MALALVFPTLRATIGKVSHIYLGVDPAFHPQVDHPVLEDLGLSSPYFLYVGTIEPRKQVDMLLRAFALFCKQEKFRDWKLVIVGQIGWKADHVVQLLDLFPYPARIRQLGYVSNSALVQLYSKAKSVIYPSSYEGFGLPVLEAMACGTPAITSKNSSLVEVGGEWALYFPTHDQSALFNRMLQVAEGRRLPSAKQLTEHARSFTWDSCAKAFWKICTSHFKAEQKRQRKPKG